MSAAVILDTLRASGLSVMADGNKLVVTPRSAITPELRQIIVAHKPVILEALVALDGTLPMSRFTVTVDTDTFTMLTRSPENAAADCLARFGERFKSIKPERVHK